MERVLYEKDHELYRETVREFLVREVEPHKDRWDTERWIDQTVFTRAASAGVYGLQIPEEYGGSNESDYRYRMIVCEEVAKINALSFGLTISCRTIWCCTICSTSPTTSRSSVGCQASRRVRRSARLP